MTNIVFIPLAITILLILFYAKKKEKSKIPSIMLLITIFYIILTIDLGINYAASLNIAFNDGISVNGILSPLFFTEDKFSIVAFKNTYYKSMCSLIGIFIVDVCCVFLAKEKKC